MTIPDTRIACKAKIRTPTRFIANSVNPLETA